MLLAEIAMMIFGIITLVKGKFTLSRERVITGAPAYAIGVILTGTFPLALCIGFAIGFFAAMNANGRPVDVSKFWYLDLVIVPIALLIVLVIASLAPKSSPETPAMPTAAFPPNYPANLPPMGDNPYASPQSDPQNPTR